MLTARICRWPAQTFGSLRWATVTIGLYIASRLADIATTYIFLRNHRGEESNPAMRGLMEWVGFFPTAVINIIFSVALLVVTVSMLSAALSKESARVRHTAAVAFSLGLTTMFSIVAIHNLFPFMETATHTESWPPLLRFFAATFALFGVVALITALVTIIPKRRNKKNAPS